MQPGQLAPEAGSTHAWHTENLVTAADYNDRQTDRKTLKEASLQHTASIIWLARCSMLRPAGAGLVMKCQRFLLRYSQILYVAVPSGNSDRTYPQQALSSDLRLQEQ